MKPFNERVNEINWSSLGHAYGSAADVPDLLIDLQSPDSAVRKNAYDKLFGNIWHQGTIYSATAYAVPFLFELLDSPSVQDKDFLVTLLASIAAGEGYYRVHQPIFESQNPSSDKHEEEIKREEIQVRSVRSIISPRFETLLEYLTNKDAEVRLSVAESAAYYPEYAEKSLARLKKALEVETDEEVIETIEDSISRLTDNEDDESN
jgi:hypothetical protein